MQPVCIGNAWRNSTNCSYPARSPCWKPCRADCGWVTDKPQVANHNPLLVSALGVSYACGGRYAEAEELIEELKNRSERDYIAPHHSAEIYLALNRTNEAFEWFERAVEEHNPLVMGMAVAQHYDPLRNKPRFRALLKKINLPNE